MTREPSLYTMPRRSDSFCMWLPNGVWLRFWATISKLLSTLMTGLSMKGLLAAVLCLSFLWSGHICFCVAPPLAPGCSLCLTPPTLSAVLTAPPALPASMGPVALKVGTWGSACRRVCGSLRAASSRYSRLTTTVSTHSPRDSSRAWYGRTYSTHSHR